MTDFSRIRAVALDAFGTLFDIPSPRIPWKSPAGSGPQRGWVYPRPAA